MITQTTGRNEIQAMNDKYNEVLAWEAQFANEIEASKVTYAEKNDGTNFTPVREYNKSKLEWRIWNRETKSFHNGIRYSNKRAAQNVIDELK